MCVFVCVCVCVCVGGGGGRGDGGELKTLFHSNSLLIIFLGGEGGGGVEVPGPALPPR